MPRLDHNRITITRATAALALGAVAGTGTLLAPQFIFSLIFASSRVPYLEVWDILKLYAAIYGLVLVYFAIGLLTVGAPTWWVLHRRSSRTPRDGFVFGGFLSLVLYMGVGLFYRLPEGIGPRQFFLHYGQFTYLYDGFQVVATVSLLHLICVALSGAAAGLTIWRVAYQTPANRGR
jgi:hypothetical protein